MELDKTRIRLLLKSEKVDIIEGLIQKNLQEANVPVFEEIKKILNRTFGEENNQLVKPTLETVLERTYIEFANSYNIINKNDESRVVSTIESNGVFHVVVRFPEITITNEKEEEHIIKDLFVQFGLSKDGMLRGHLNGLRASITSQEYDAGYLHSHLESFPMDECLTATASPYGDVIENGTGGVDFGNFCTGEGPIIQVMTQLRAKYDPNLFQLFCLHLKNFVKWESLEGSPYIRMGTVSTRSRFRRRSLTPLRPNTLDLFVGRIVRQILSQPDRYNLRSAIRSIQVTERGISVGDGNEIREIINRAAIENKEKVFPNEGDESMGIVARNHTGFVVPYCYDDNYKSETGFEDHRTTRIRSANRTLLTFKGQTIKLKLLDIDKKEENEEETLYAHPSIVTAVFSRLSTILTEKAREIRRAEIANSAS